MSLVASLERIADLDLSAAVAEVVELIAATETLAATTAAARTDLERLALGAGTAAEAMRGLAQENTRFAASQNPQSAGGSRYIGTGPNAALNALDAAAAGITDALIEGNAKIRGAYEDFVQYRNDLAALKLDEAAAINKLQQARDAAARTTDPNERARQQAEQARWEAEAKRINALAKQQADQHAAQLATLEAAVAAGTRTAAGREPGVEKRYEIQFKTPDGRTETVTTTTDPRAFLDALERARGVT